MPGCGRYLHKMQRTQHLRGVSKGGRTKGRNSQVIVGIISNNDGNSICAVYYLEFALGEKELVGGFLIFWAILRVTIQDSLTKRLVTMPRKGLQFQSMHTSLVITYTASSSNLPNQCSLTFISVYIENTQKRVSFLLSFLVIHLLL